MEQEGLPLQAIIAQSAYTVIEKYQKFKPAKELIQMLGTIARKPDSLQRQIQLADASRMIAMIEKADSNQQQWFHALTSTKVFENEKSRDCVEKYCYLCTDADLDRLLNMSINYNNKETRQVILKCASCLDVAELTIVITRYFRKFGIFTDLDDGTLKDQLVIVLNKMEKNTTADANFTKEMLLLLLQNPGVVLEYLYGECMKNSIYSTCLRDLFRIIKEIITTESLAENMLLKVFKNSPLQEDNIQQVKDLLLMLLQSECITYSTLLESLILPDIENNTKNEDYRNVYYLLEVCNVSLLTLLV